MTVALWCNGPRSGSRSDWFIPWADPSQMMAMHLQGFFQQSQKLMRGFPQTTVWRKARLDLALAINKFLSFTNMPLDHLKFGFADPSHLSHLHPCRPPYTRKLSCEAS
jgi:hypothetical protein